MTKEAIIKPENLVYKKPTLMNDNGMGTIVRSVGATASAQKPIAEANRGDGTGKTKQSVSHP